MRAIRTVCFFMLCLLVNFSAIAAEKNTTHDFSFPDGVSGNQFELGKQPAQWTLLAFWRVDCEPCLLDMPVLAEFSKKNGGVRVLGISLSRKEETHEQWQKMAMPFPTLVNTGFPGELLEEYGNELGAVPYTVLLKPDRALCWSVVGKITSETLQAALQHCQH
jgi:thiol-disulfide isomerase/thioredoxin